MPFKKNAAIKLASIHDVPADFVPLGCGFYKEAHTIWELRASEDEDEGFVLTRKREERDASMRPEHKTATTQPAVEKTASVKTAHLVQKDGKWALVSKHDSSKVLRWFGKEKPSNEAVAKEERRVQWFKNKG
jgi:hypothetical protein